MFCVISGLSGVSLLFQAGWSGSHAEISHAVDSAVSWRPSASSTEETSRRMGLKRTSHSSDFTAETHSASQTHVNELRLAAERKLHGSL